MKQYICMGDVGYEKSEIQRQNLGMSIEQYTEFVRKQAVARLRVLELERELIAAKEAYYESCILEVRP
jgi:hypothetical protein